MRGAFRPGVAGSPIALPTHPLLIRASSDIAKTGSASCREARHPSPRARGTFSFPSPRERRTCSFFLLPAGGARALFPFPPQAGPVTFAFSPQAGTCSFSRLPASGEKVPKADEGRFSPRRGKFADRAAHASLADSGILGHRHTRDLVIRRCAPPFSPQAGSVSYALPLQAGHVLFFPSPRKRGDPFDDADARKPSHLPAEVLRAARARCGGGRGARPGARPALAGNRCARPLP